MTKARFRNKGINSVKTEIVYFFINLKLKLFWLQMFVDAVGLTRINQRKLDC